MDRSRRNGERLGSREDRHSQCSPIAFRPRHEPAMSSFRPSVWSDARSWRPNFSELALALQRAALPAALPAAMLLAATLTLTLSSDRAAASETLFLGFWAAAVFTPLAFLETARRPVHATLGLAVAVLVATLPRAGGLRTVAISALLALSVLILASLALALRRAPDLRTGAALALSAAIVLHGHRLFLHGFALSTLVVLAILPGVAAVAATRLAAGGKPGLGLAVALALLAAPQLTSEPWWILLAFATAAVSAGFGGGAGARLAHRSLFVFAAATLLAGSFPWLRAAPVATLLGAAGTLGRPVAETPLDERVVVLTEASPRFTFELSGVPVRSLVIDSYLTHGVDLACGQEFARLKLGEVNDAIPLVAGRDSAEWAAGRPDVAARLACPAPEPWISWIPGAGRFLGQTTRARFALREPSAARNLVIERSPALPADTSLAIFFLATER